MPPEIALYLLLIGTSLHIAKLEIDMFALSADWESRDGLGHDLWIVDCG